MMIGHRTLITGGAGFVGSNYSKHLLDMNAEVVVFDNFARGKGCENNLHWLRSHPKSRNLKLVKGEVSSVESLEEASKGCDLIVHTAAQVSVPESVSKPRLDFDSNALGTFNVLEVARKLQTDPVIIYTSSNKVYGIPDAALHELDLRYDFEDLSEEVDRVGDLANVGHSIPNPTRPV